MLRLFLALMLVAYSGATYASCYGKDMAYGGSIRVDLSDKLSESSPEWTGSFTTQYSGSFSCSTKNSEFGYTPILSTNSAYATILGFSNGKYNVRAEIINAPPNTKLTASGSHQAGELNVPFSVRFTLVKNKGTSIANNMAILNDVMVATDLSGMSLLEIIVWPGKQLIKILQWLLSGFNWPYDQRDMFGQPMVVTYAPKMATCSLVNAGLTVVLPRIGVSQLVQTSQAGLTPFTLNLRCENMATPGISDRAIDMFLSSNWLLATDPSVLVDTDSAAAKGVGLRLVKLNDATSPITMTNLTTTRGNATSLFNAAAGGALNETFSIPMAVYYYAYRPKSLAPGKINTSATLNIIYP